MERIIIPGAAGLVGQNLIIQLKRAGYDDIIAIDKHPTNTKILKKLHPDITVLESDLVTDAGWTEYLSSDSILIMLQAQIGSIDAEDFQKNNIISTEKVIEAAKQAGLKYIIHISSSVVESVADDQYTETKKKQEAMVVDSGIP
jgi:nucleoside-diphosphate-sugar epimerase